MDSEPAGHRRLEHLLEGGLRRVKSDKQPRHGR
jgi:hypothetical protein